MEGFDVAGLLNAGYAAPSMAPMATPSMTTSTAAPIKSGLLSPNEAVTAPTSTRGMYNLLGDVPFSVSPGGEVYTPPPFPEMVPFSNPFFNPFGTPNYGLFGNFFNSNPLIDYYRSQGAYDDDIPENVTDAMMFGSGY